MPANSIGLVGWRGFVTRTCSNPLLPRPGPCSVASSCMAFEMAAAYLFHLAKNHPFFDGNKRVAAAAAVAFLELNGWRFIANDDAYADLVLEVARGNADKPAIAAFLRANVQPI